MRYEFYDLERNLLGEREDPEGEAQGRNEEIILHLEGLTPTHWRVVDITEPVDGVQKVAIRPI